MFYLDKLFEYNNKVDNLIVTHLTVDYLLIT